MANSLQMSPETGSENFLKAQIAVFEVVGALLTCTKRELKATIFKTDEDQSTDR